MNSTLQQITNWVSKGVRALTIAGLLAIPLAASPTASVAAPAAQIAPISGKVFRDYNSDGQITTGTDNGVSGVLVTAVNAAGQSWSATTNTSGNYSISPSAAGPYRVSFTNLPSGYFATTHGTQNGTSTQFLAGSASNVNFGVAQAGDKCFAAQDMCTTVMVNGNATVNGPALFKFTTAGGLYGGVAQQSQIGTAWGLAYKPDTKQMFAAAMVRRHTGLGPQGLGGIYVYNAATGAVSNFMDLDGAPYNINFGTLPSNATRGLPANQSTANTDPLAFSAVGAQGMGDLEISEDYNSLWAVNLYAATDGLGSLIKINVNGGVPGAVTQYLLSGMSGVPTCTLGVFRPWALKFAKGKGYLGGVCSGESGGTSANLSAYVLSFNPANPTALTTVLTIPLNYTKGASNGAYAFNSFWQPWSSDENTFTTGQTCDGWGCSIVNRQTPLLTGLDFDNSGAMIIGLMDRTGWQFGHANYLPSGAGYLWTAHAGGDILRACLVGGSYQLESNGVCGGVNGSSVGNGQGPGGGEYYSDDSVFAPHHQETFIGGLSNVPAYDNVIWTAYTIADYNQNGVRLNINADGNRVGLAFPGSTGGVGFTSATGGTTGPFMSKAGGLGDMELMCDPAPIEIGNRVWNDQNGNGVQDAGEPGLPNITVSLQGPGGATVTTNTDINGLYYFNNLQANTAYTLLINPTGQAALNGLTATTANAAALSGASATSNDAVNDTIDSDATLVGGQATIAYTTGSAGQNNHGLDFGFRTPPSTPTPTPIPTSTNTPVPPTATPTSTPVPQTADLAVTKSASVTSITSGVPFNYLLTVVNNGPGTAPNVVLTDVLPAGLIVNTITPSAGGACTNTAGTIRCTWPSLAVGASATVAITVTP